MDSVMGADGAILPSPSCLPSYLSPPHTRPLLVTGLTETEETIRTPVTVLQKNFSCSHTGEFLDKFITIQRPAHFVFD